MRVLVVTNITPDPHTPARGRFIRDQVEAMRRAGVDVELHSIPSGRSEYPRAPLAIRRRLRDRGPFDLVHAHYGLAGWCAWLAGARPLIVTYHGTDVRHRVVGPSSRWLAGRLALAAGVSRALFAPEAGRPGLRRRKGRSAVLPCGADLERFRPLPRGDARALLGLDPAGRYLLFPAATGRQVKRHDRAAAVAREAHAELITGGEIEAERMPEWMNAANAVLVTSDNEGFGLVAVEALACDVPVLSTPVGVAPLLLRGIEGCLVEPFDVGRWAGAVSAHLDSRDPRVSGRDRATWFAAEPLAERVLTTYREILNRSAD